MESDEASSGSSGDCVLNSAQEEEDTAKEAIEGDDEILSCQSKNFSSLLAPGKRASIQSKDQKSDKIGPSSMEIN